MGINLALHEPSSPTSCVYVQDLAPEGSAAKGGLKSGDVIVRVDDTKFGLGEKYVPQDVAAHIKGPEGSSVTVVVNRDGVLKEFQLTRKPIAAIGALLVPQNLNKAEKASLPLPRNNPIRLSAATPAIRLSAETPEKKTNRIDEDPGCIVDQFCCTNKNTASLESLNLKVENTDGQDGMTSSAYECSDKVDDLLPHAQLKRLHSKSESIDAEEKTDDEDISSVVNSVGSNEWELISERSGSAIMVSLTGSLNGSHDYRSVSPSLLKNNFVLTESNGEELEHVILPTDTLQGLCLAYKISATKLRMENSFSGNNLQMAPKKLRIPTPRPTKGSMVRMQDRTTKQFKLYAFVAEIPTMELVEAKAYLDLANWDLEEALQSAREDDGLGWNVSGGGETPIIDSPLLSAVRQPKALTADDIYLNLPTLEGDGVELKDIKQDIKP